MLTGHVIHLGKKYSAIVIAISLLSSSFGFNLPIVNAEEPKKDDLLQFTSENHIVGFRSDGVYVASARRVLTTKFLRANKVTPISDGNTDADASGKVPALGTVTYKNIWNGIDAVYEGGQEEIMKSTYFVDITKKGVTSNSIRLQYNRPVEIDANGNLKIIFKDGFMTEEAPIAWQDTSEGRRPVAVSFKLYRKNVVGFKLGKYLPNYPIVVDPSLTWNTFLGSSGSEYVTGIGIDSSGNVYVGGIGTATWGSPIRAFSAANDGYVAKLNSSGTLVWNTFLGGGSHDYTNRIIVDTNGNVFAGGNSVSTWGSPVNAFSAGYDGYIAKLNSSGAIVWNTFFGGSGTEDVNGIAVDSIGNVYVAGYSNATWGSPVLSYTSGTDGLVIKLNSSGAIVWNTFLGGSGTFDQARGIAIDNTGNVYVAGYNNATWGSPLRAYASGYDGFVSKLDNNGALLWNTFFGASATDILYDILIDTHGDIYTGGYSGSTWGSPIRAYTSSTDISLVKLDSNGTIIWHTFLGGSGSDSANKISMDTSGNVYVGGNSGSTWGSPINAYTSSNDDVIAKLDSNGNLLWNTFFGGSGNDILNGIIIDTSGNIYAGGYTGATWGSPVNPYSSGLDGMVAKFLDDIIAPTAAITYSTSDPYTSGDAVTITATFSEAMLDSPVPQISISGSQTLAATNMTKVSTTVYTYALTVGSGNGTATIAMSTGTDTSSNVVTSTPTSGATFTVDNTVAVTTTSTETSSNTHTIRHGGGRGSLAPGRGGKAPMIDFKTLQVISTTDSSRTDTSSSASPERQQSSPAVLLLQNQRTKLLTRIEKKIEAALTSAARKMLESNRDRLLKRIDARIQSLSGAGG